MRILLIGDIVGRPGRRIVERCLRALRKRENLSCVIANGENSADGSGITPAIFKDLINAGVDCVTLGDHIYRRKEISETLVSDSRILKPANYPQSAPGRGWTTIEAANGEVVAVFSLMARVFMKPVDCPFMAADRVLGEMPQDVPVRILDFHAEATSDMQLMGRYLDGRASAVLGTHTHVATADQQIFSGGTAFQCDVGMTGPYESILGRRIDRVLETTLTFNPTHFQVATEDVRMCGTIVDIDPKTGLASNIERLVVTQAEAEELAVAREMGSPSER